MDAAVATVSIVGKTVATVDDCGVLFELRLVAEVAAIGGCDACERRRKLVSVKVTETETAGD